MIDNLSEIKQNSDIVSVIEHFLPLKKSGANFATCCPFHDEKSASFIVSKNKQIYTCFGCGESGDAISFLQKHLKLDFNEAVLKLAELVGITPIIKGGVDSSYSYKKELFKRLEAFNKMLINTLITTKSEMGIRVRQYLYNRGLSDEDFSYYGIGLLESESDVLNYFSKKEALELGLLYNNYVGSFMGKRIVFSIRNNSHKIVGFSARTHPYYNFRQLAKYINSKESWLFKKAQNLYMFSYAKTELKKEIYIVEGFMDSIALHKLGFKNAVATCGTAFNIQHLTQILRINRDIIFNLFFDNDNAGGIANLRALELLFKNGFYNGFVCILKDSFKDVGEVLENKAKLEFNKIPFIEYYIKKRLKIAQNAREKDKIVLDLKELIQNENNFFNKQFLLESICSVTSIPKEFFISTNAKASKNSDSLLESFIFSLFNDDSGDYAFIFENSNILHLMPKELQGSISGFLKGRVDSVVNQYRVLDLPFLNINQFNMYILSLQKNEYLKQLDIAKVKKDVKHIDALTQAIRQINADIQQEMIF
ncbi:MAG: DNA primase [Helicobacteraceae bacterium]|nr:DNA primase [Helicobacteraceae bacterium]